MREVKTFLPLTSMLLSASAGWSLARAWADPGGRILFLLAGSLALTVVLCIAVRAVRDFKVFRQAHRDLKAAHMTLMKFGDNFEQKDEIERRVKAAQEVIRKYFEP